MEDWVQMLLTALVSMFGAVMGSTGFWAFIQKKGEKQKEEKERNKASNRMLRGLGHVKIMERGLKFIERGYITKDEYEDFYLYLYEPYRELGGNGSAKKVMDEVAKLPIHASHKKESGSHADSR